MPALPIGTSSYERADLPEIVLRNLYWEQTPVAGEEQSALISRPGCAEFVDGDLTGSLRGVYRQDGVLSGDNYVVFGTALSKVTQAGVVTSVGMIAGSGRVVMAGNKTNILIATGTTSFYSTNGSAVSSVTFPDTAVVTSVNFLNNYFLAVRGSSQRVYFSAVGGITFDPLDYFSAENSPDDLVNIGVNGDELWMFGQQSVEVYVPSGDPDAPFLRINGRVFPMGLAQRDALVKGDDGLVWVGQDRIVYHDSASPVPISTETINQKLRENLTADLTLWSYVVEGKIAYVLNIGTLHSFAFVSGKWTEYAGFGGDYLPLWGSARQSDGRIMVGDTLGPRLWLLDPTSTYDGEDQMILTFTGMADIQGNSSLCSNVLLDCSVALGAADFPTDDPTIQLRISKDRGRTFGNWITTKLGRQGVYSETVYWNRLGLMQRPGWMFQFRTAPPSRFTVRRARMNERLL